MEEMRSVSRFINSRSRSQDRIQKEKGMGHCVSKLMESQNRFGGENLGMQNYTPKHKPNTH